jgi:hypothetical protein
MPWSRSRLAVLDIAFEKKLRRTPDRPDARREGNSRELVRQPRYHGGSALTVAPPSIIARIVGSKNM